MKKLGILMGAIALLVTMLAGCGNMTENTSGAVVSKKTIETPLKKYEASEHIMKSVYFSGFLDEDTLVLTQAGSNTSKVSYYTVEKGSVITHHSIPYEGSEKSFKVVELNPKENTVTLTLIEK